MITKEALRIEFQFKEKEGIISKKFGSITLAIKGNLLSCRARPIVNLDFITKKELRSIINRVVNALSK